MKYVNEAMQIIYLMYDLDIYERDFDLIVYKILIYRTWFFVHHSISSRRSDHNPHNYRTSLHSEICKVTSQIIKNYVK